MSVTVPAPDLILRNVLRDSATETSRARWARRIRVAAALAMLGPGLSGCILGSERPDLNLDIPASYREAPRGQPDAAVPAVDWWRGFHSSELPSLMQAATAISRL